MIQMLPGHPVSIGQYAKPRLADRYSCAVI